MTKVVEPVRRTIPRVAVAAVRTSCPYLVLVYLKALIQVSAPLASWKNLLHFLDIGTSTWGTFSNVGSPVTTGWDKAHGLSTGTIHTFPFLSIDSP